MSGADSPDTKVAEAARGFDAELHTRAYAQTHSDSAQLARLLAFLAPAAGQLILDLGTGNGYVAMAVARAEPACRVIGVDVAAQAIARDAEIASAQGLANAAFLAYEGVTLPFADDHFDAAVSRYAFHHFPRPLTSLTELGRTLRLDGRLALADAIRDDADDVDFVNRFQALKGDGHVCMQRRDDLIELVDRHGFEVREVFESSIAFDRERSAGYDRLLDATPDPVLQSYSVSVAEQCIHLKFRILNLLLVNRR
jgi:SAM-dependent methyltransferase